MRYDWRNKLEWKWQGSQSTGQNGFPLTIYRAELGKDEQGRTWMVECTPMMMYGGNTFRLLFDHNEEPNEDNGWEGDSPFLRDEVIYADNFMKAQKERYHMREVVYSEIVRTIEAVTDEIGIVG